MTGKYGDVSRSHVDLAENLKGKDFADLLQKKLVGELTQSQVEFERGSISKAGYHLPILSLHWRWLVLKDVWEEPKHTDLSDLDCLQWIEKQAATSVVVPQKTPPVVQSVTKKVVQAGVQARKPSAQQQQQQKQIKRNSTP